LYSGISGCTSVPASLLHTNRAMSIPVVPTFPAMHKHVRNKGGGQVYPSGQVENPSEARTLLANCFNILLEPIVQ
jgi:hypothetical protein